MQHLDLIHLLSAPASSEKSSIINPCVQVFLLVVGACEMKRFLDDAPTPNWPNERDDGMLMVEAAAEAQLVRRGGSRDGSTRVVALRYLVMTLIRGLKSP